jgi:hypothetical protein
MRINLFFGALMVLCLIGVETQGFTDNDDEDMVCGDIDPGFIGSLGSLGTMVDLSSLVVGYWAQAVSKGQGTLSGLPRPITSQVLGDMDPSWGIGPFG